MNEKIGLRNEILLWRNAFQRLPRCGLAAKIEVAKALECDRSQ